MTRSEKIIRKFWRMKAMCTITRLPSLCFPTPRSVHPWTAWIHTTDGADIREYGRTQAEACERAMKKMKEGGA